MAIIGNGTRYVDIEIPCREDFEDDVVSSSKTLFGRALSISTPRGRSSQNPLAYSA